MKEQQNVTNKSDFMRNYYIQINEYLQKSVRNIIMLDKKGIEAGGSSLSIMDILILKMLASDQGKTMSEVMEVLEIDRNTFKTIIQRMATQEYITKTRSHDDKRVYDLQLTDGGRRVFEEIAEKENQMLISLLNDFTFNEERTILKFLVKLEMLNKEKK